MEGLNKTTNVADTLDSSINLVEDEEMTRESLFHTNYSIYLYCTVESNIAGLIMNNGIQNFPIPLKLYETKDIAKEMAKNVKNMSTIKVAANLFIGNGEIYYDQLTMSNKQKEELKKRAGCKTDAELVQRCAYTRGVAKLEKYNMKVIEYMITDTNRLSSPQYANTL